MQAAFAAHIPGSIVIDEHSTATLAATSGEAIITARTLKAIYGNVEIRVTISRVAGREASRQTVRLTHAGYVLDFDFIGYYPPTASQLRALADDPRLVAPTA